MATRAQFAFSGFYASKFVLLGVQLPFYSGWLALQGFTAPEIGWITGGALVARLLFGPIYAAWADGADDPRAPFRFASLLYAVGAIGVWLEPGKPAIAAASILFLWAFGVLVPLSDNAAVRADGAGGVNYGKARATGSMAFVATTLLAGVVLSRYGLQQAAAIMAAAGAATFGFSWLVPIEREAGAPPASGGEVTRLLGDRRFLLLITSAGLVQGGHAVYYAFSILHWSALGYSATVIGALWAVGVVAEILLLTRARSLAAQFSPIVMIIAGGAGAVLRWAITAAEPALPVLFVVQCLHALTFAAAYLGAVDFIKKAAPPRLANTAMTLMSTTGVGAMTGVATILAGYVFDRAGAPAAYLMMSAMGVVSIAAALVLSRLWRGERLF